MHKGSFLLLRIIYRKNLPNKNKQMFEKPVDKSEHTFYTYQQWNARRPVQSYKRCWQHL